MASYLPGLRTTSRADPSLLLLLPLSTASLLFLLPVLLLWLCVARHCPIHVLLGSVVLPWGARVHSSMGRSYIGHSTPYGGQSFLAGLPEEERGARNLS